jgi:hypothetical protein
MKPESPREALLIIDYLLKCEGGLNAFEAFNDLVETYPDVKWQDEIEAICELLDRTYALTIDDVIVACRQSGPVSSCNLRF